MSDHTVTVFRAGVLGTEPAPEWMRQVHRLAPSAGWYGAIEKVLQDEGGVTEVQGRGEVAVQVSDWPTLGGGRFVEFSDRGEVIASVWVPDAADWLVFHAGHIAPFLSLHVAIARLGALERIGNALIAYARHGEGDHIETDSGHSGIDIARERPRYRRSVA